MTESPTLTRRDALAALVAGGVVAGGTAALAWDDLDEEADVVDDHVRRTVRAVAETVYPSAVDGISAFVESYLAGRIEAEPERGRAVADAVAALDDHVETWYDARFAALHREDRDAALRAFGVDVAEPDPDGSDVEHVRYYLVNDLLYALYTSPTGGELVGIENPQGYPGGTDSYRRPP